MFSRPPRTYEEFASREVECVFVAKNPECFSKPRSFVTMRVGLRESAAEILTDL